MTASADWKHPGARWWKFDFHTHTPASADTYWAKSNVDLSPEQWLLRYMQAEVDCVAVTDHNGGAWIDRLKSAYESMRAAPPAAFRELFLFPGVELSINGGFHLLAIFDPSTSTSDIDTLLGRVDYGGTKGDSDGVTRRSAIDVVDAVLQSGGLPIPAHADKAKGLLELKDSGSAASKLDANTVRQLCDSKKILAVEVIDAGVAKPAVYLESGCRWTEVIGSDSHTFQEPNAPGSRFTWVKMAKPSREGLRLALLDGAGFSVRRSEEADGFDPFHLPEHYIQAIEISKARYMGQGQPATLKFSPWFNALVGGRGTGKSTVVHGLRLGYRRADELQRLGEENECRRVFDAFARVSKNRTDQGGLRADTEIVVTLSRDGVPHRLRWRQDAAGDVVEEPSGGSWTTSASQAVTPERFPIRIFSQGQIAALAGESQAALLGVIDEAAGTRGAKQRLEDAKQRFLALRARARELDGKLKARDEVQVKLGDVQRKLAGFEGKEHTEILRSFQLRSRQEREVQRQIEGGRALGARIEELAKQIVPEDLPAGLFDGEDAADRTALAIIGRLHEAVAKAAETLQAAGNTLAAVVTSTHAEINSSEWCAAVAGAKDKYTALVAELKEQGVTDPSEYGKLVQERQRLETELLRLDSLRNEQDKLAADWDEQRKRVRAARLDLSTVRHRFLTSTLAQNQYVRIDLVPYGQDARAIERAMRETLGVTDDRFGDDILVVENDVPSKGFVADLLRGPSDDTATAASRIEERLDALGERFTRACSGQAEFGGHFNKYVQRECGKHPELLDRLLVWSPDDALQVDYSPKGDGTNFRSIRQASAGQRAAAMLAFLLAHGAEPLVLDQPEDDLDNHLIYDLVVRQIRENKMRRQMIVVTHNPNIVVNGDAEVVHVLDFDGGQCRVVRSGSLQEVAMRDEVCRVMEGGREAFERRYRRLGGR